MERKIKKQSRLGARGEWASEARHILVAAGNVGPCGGF